MATFAAPSPTVTQRPSLKKKKLAMLILAVSSYSIPIRNKKHSFWLFRIAFFLVKLGYSDQRRKNLGSRVAFQPGKFLRVKQKKN